MTRPLYETHIDVKNELAVINTVAVLARMEAVKLPIRYSVDFALIKDKSIRAWIEVKCRKNQQAAYSTLMISAAKLMDGVNLATQSGRPFFLIVRWTDKLGRLKINDLTNYNLGFGGRKDRSDAQDLEPVYEIPIKQFEIIAAVDGGRLND